MNHPGDIACPTYGSAHFGGDGVFSRWKKTTDLERKQHFYGELFLLELQQKTGNIRSVESLKNLFALSCLLKY